MITNNLPTLRIPSDSVMLPDNDQYRFRFEIHSESSNRVYIVSQNKKGKFWCCSCMGWKRYRKCKHLIAVNLPCFCEPHEVKLAK